ncbi:MAG TPA: cyclic nucleotide-binding and patatin-like phospholipase domain-containing protein [Actinomycetota bacterium]|nr:cyclic nucleotide-binding and patatin-like phospholipase domain-containing protein [Actinomycetota bacterium]
MGTPPDDLGFFDRDRLMKSRRPKSRAHNLLFLIESWSDPAGSDDLLEFLAGTEVFSGLTQADLRSLMPHLEPVHAAAGELVLESGKPNDALYVVGHGRLEAGSAGTATFEAGPGQVIGAGALLLGDSAGSWARAMRDSVLLRLTASSFKAFAERHPQALLGLCRELVRISTSTDRNAARSAADVCTVAVVPAGSRALPGGFVDGLAAALGRAGRTLTLSAPVLDAQMGAGTSEVGLDDPRNGGVVAWLHRAEQEHRFVLYETDPRDTTWTQRCLRQADRVVLVAEAGGDPAPGELEHVLRAGEALGPAGSRCHLVLLHGVEVDNPSGTAAWLENRTVAMHHHVRRDRIADFRRLARHLSGNACGLVLGGGGAMGFAHLGVIRALDEAGIAIDIVGGTSIGAVMGALFARDLDHEGRVRAAVSALVESGNIVGMTLPLVSVSSARKVSRLLSDEPAFGGFVEDLWRPFFCVSASLGRVEEVIHERGRTWRAIRASVSLPGVWPPVFEQGDLLVDGGVLNNLPVDVMAAKIQSGPIIAVDLHPGTHSSPSEPFDVSLSGWRILSSRINPFVRTIEMPRILDVVMRSMSLASTRSQRERLVDHPIALYLRPPLSDGARMNFGAGAGLIESAYRHTSAHLEANPWPAQI